MTWRWSRVADPSYPLIPRHVREPGGFLGVWAAPQRAADDKPSYSWGEQACPEAIPAASRSVLLGVPHEVGSGVETKHPLQITSLRGPWGRRSKAVCYSKSCVRALLSAAHREFIYFQICIHSFQNFSLSLQMAALTPRFTMWGPFTCAEENHHALVWSAHYLQTPVPCVPPSGTLAHNGVCREEGLQVAFARH